MFGSDGNIPSFAITQIQSTRPLNSGLTTLLGDKDVLHVKLDGELYPPIQPPQYRSKLSSGDNIFIVQEGDSWSFFSDDSAGMESGACSFVKCTRNPPEVTLTRGEDSRGEIVFAVDYALWYPVGTTVWSWRMRLLRSYIVAFHRKNDDKWRYNSFVSAWQEGVGDPTTVPIGIVRKPDLLVASMLADNMPKYSICNSFTDSSNNPSSFLPVTPSIDRISLTSHMEMLQGFAQSQKKGLFDELETAHSDVSQSICENAQCVDVNSLAYIKDIVELSAAVRSGNFSTLTSMLNSKSALKGASKALLSSEYGVRLTVKDTREIMKSLKKSFSNRNRYKIGRGACSFSTECKFMKKTIKFSTEEHYKCVYDSWDRSLRGIIRNLYNADLALTLDNTWDLVPFSFVVDWFLPIGDYCNQVDAQAYLATLDIVDVLHSIRTSALLPIELLKLYGNVSGYVEYVRYERKIESTLPPIVSHFTGIPKFKNFLELGAILITKHKGR